MAIAHDHHHDSTPHRVPSAIAAYGPFPTPQRALAGHLTFRQLANRLGISGPALQRRLDHGEVPDAAGRHRNGGPYWRAGDIEPWIATLQLTRCPPCGAYLKRLGWHTISRHEQPPRQTASGTTPAAPGRHRNHSLTRRPLRLGSVTAAATEDAAHHPLRA